jgi:hypothetical protein
VALALHFSVLALVLASATPAPTPSPAATSALTQWLHDLRNVSYTSQTGASISLSTLIDRFPYKIANAPATISFDRVRALIDVEWSGFHLLVPASDVPAPPSPTPEAVKSSPIGLAYNALLAQFHADKNLASKNLVTGTGGTIVLITAMDEDPGAGSYDHGPQGFFYREYVMRDGVVVAYAWRQFEN